MNGKSELITLRIPRSLYAVIMGISKKSNLYFSDVLRTAVKYGISTKECSVELSEKTELYKKEVAFEQGDLELRIILKEAYSVSNFKKLVNQLAVNSEISRTKKMQVVQKIFERIEKTEGRNSESYCEAQKWLISNYPQLVYRSRESDFKVKVGRDIITE